MSKHIGNGSIGKPEKPVEKKLLQLPDYLVLFSAATHQCLDDESQWANSFFKHFRLPACHQAEKTPKTIDSASATAAVAVAGQPSLVACPSFIAISALQKRSMRSTSNIPLRGERKKRKSENWKPEEKQIDKQIRFFPTIYREACQMAKTVAPECRQERQGQQCNLWQHLLSVHLRPCRISAAEVFKVFNNQMKVQNSSAP